MSATSATALARADAAGLEYHATGLALPAGMSFEQWVDVGRTLQMMERSVNWWVGDWLNYGEHRYGEKYTQALEGTDRRLQSLMNMASIAGRIEPARRRPALSWSCHRAVAYLEPADQDRILAEAEVAGWGSREVEEAVAKAKRAIPAPATTKAAPHLVGAKDEAPSLFDEEEPDNLPARVDSAPSAEPADTEPSEPKPDEGGYDLATELEHLEVQVRDLQREVDALSASDLGAEVRGWTEKYARLEGRLQQEIATSREAQRQAKYYGDLLKKIRTTLGVSQTQGILPRILELVQEVGR